MKPSTLVKNEDGKLVDSRNDLLYGSADWQEAILDQAMSRAEQSVKEQKANQATA